MGKDKERHTVWLTSEAWKKVESHYRQDDCSTKNEFIEKAVRFYCGYLDTERADEYLPCVLAEVLEGKLSALGARMGHLLFKLAVEQDILANLVSSLWELDLDEVARLRARCVKNVKATNGEIKLEDAVRFQRGLD